MTDTTDPVVPAAASEDAPLLSTGAVEAPGAAEVAEARPAAPASGDDLADEEEAGDLEDAVEAGPPPTTFADLGLSDALLRAVSDAGYLHPTPIQEQAIPVVLTGRDVLGCAQTGTGKTAGFTLPMIEILSGSRAKARMPRSLILEPTRELALQVAENFVKYGKHLNLVHALLIGGESMGDQRAVLDRGVDVLIATPGRLLDLFERGRILLADCKILVIDEADRMLDMGFIPDVERIVSMLPPLRQTLFFSATMAPEIRRLADAFLSNPREITVSRPASVAATITTGLVMVRDGGKVEALRRLIQTQDVQNALIFCNRKRDVDVLYKTLGRHGLSVGALHGDMDQSARFATLARFKAGEVRLLVCSDVAARGLDIGGLSHVFNYDVPFHAEDYVHRIGRTGRAGREGHAYTIATPEDAKAVAAIVRLTGAPIPPMPIDGIEPPGEAEVAAAAAARPARGRSGRTPAAPREAAAPRPAAPERAPRPVRERARPAAPPPPETASADGAAVVSAETPVSRTPPVAAPVPVLADGAKAPIRPRRERSTSGLRRGAAAEAPIEAPAPVAAPVSVAAPPVEIAVEAPPTAEAAAPAPRRARAPRRGRDEVRTPREEARPVRDEAPEPAAAPPALPAPRCERAPEPRREPEVRREREAEPRRLPRAGSREDRGEGGPTVVGFGDAVPAFMLIPIPRARRETPGAGDEGTEAEAA